MDVTTFMGFLGACLAALATTMIFQPGTWYHGLKKPDWTPPDWAFPAVWAVLYLLVAMAATRVAALPGNGTALAFWSLQIALATLWTPVLLGGRHIRTGLVVVTLHWLAAALTFTAFWGLDWIAALMLLPYLGWLTLLTALNFRIWRDNPAGA